ncbi:NUDIX hydrolase [Desulfonema magnum]|uniref:NUDIX hydrolase domain-containing protein n=1 Tax=Desulfonema magnum TaxID=45655 RepID=A0A975BMI2_9BACT|nr:NUDIX hydrolase [Desulfonema magnum]QTA88246.1 NUDIX hydrolase domain-containing protein [Desulfonema magnum]
MQKNSEQNDELLDIVDGYDNVIGQKWRSEVYQEGLSCFRAVNAFLVNSRGQIWIPRRTADKKIFSLCLDVSMGGHVSSGESYEAAFQRELKEELNLDTEEIDYRFLGYLTPHKNSLSAFMKVYEIQSDHAPNYNLRDFIEFFWLTPQQALEKIERGWPSKGDLPKLIQIFYGS